jgi:tripartite ATP-independent transporter DctM subunit
MGWAAALTFTKTTLYYSIAHWLYICIPMFILMGHFASRSGIITDIYHFFNVWLRRLPGALALVTIATSAMFAFATGSSLAATAVLGRICLPEMDRHNYRRKLSLGSIVAGGSLGNLIPPSIGLPLFGIITEQSIGKLLMAAVFPGLMVSGLFMIMIIIMVKRNPEIAPPVAEKVSLKEKLVSFKNVWGLFVIIVFVLGSIFMGLATVTEAASVGAFISFLIFLQRRKFSWRTLGEILIETGRTSAMIFFIIASVTLFSRFLTFSGLTRGLANLIVGSGNVPPVLILLGIYVVFLIFGCLMDATSMMLILTPIFFPIITKVGIDPIWFGVMTVIWIEIGFLTPPVGMCCYVLKSVSNAPLDEIFNSIYPFLVAWFIGVALMTAFPNIALFLPKIMAGG